MQMRRDLLRELHLRVQLGKQLVLLMKMLGVEARSTRLGLLVELVMWVATINCDPIHLLLLLLLTGSNLRSLLLELLFSSGSGGKMLDSASRVATLLTTLLLLYLLHYHAFSDATA